MEVVGVAPGDELVDAHIRRPQRSMRASASILPRRCVGAFYRLP
jgi:hypothetical protein